MVLVSGYMECMNIEATTASRGISVIYHFDLYLKCGTYIPYMHSTKYTYVRMV